ncbi:MAG: tetratricopeptide repeat protein [Sphingomonadales bacterium]
MSRIDKLAAFLKESPSDSFLQHALALEYQKIGDTAKARALFEKLLQENPDYVGSYYHLAKLLEGQGDEAGALTVYEKGMTQATLQNDKHALGELRSAWEELST